MMMQKGKTLKKRVGVLISGTGSNMQALTQQGFDPDFPAKVCLVISDKDDAKGIKLARDMGVDTHIIAREAYHNKADHEGAILAALELADIDIICLAGYMQILSPAFVSKWAGKIINIHPSLLPLFPGLNTHERAIAARCHIHGCTVHFVTQGIDEGPIIKQTAIAVSPNDTPRELAARVLKMEHIIYPCALGLLAAGDIFINAQGRIEYRK